MESGNVSGSDLKANQAVSPSENNNSNVSPNKSSSSLSGEPIPGTPKSGNGNPSKDEKTDQEDGAFDEGSPLPTSDRIPSYVFARTSPTPPAEWSIASNESLFSIHTGNMSFSKEQLNWMNKSGELYYNGDPTFSGPLIDLPPGSYTPGTYTPTRKSTEIITNKNDSNMNESQFGANEAAADTMREVLREKESQNKLGDIAKDHSRSQSQHSDASVKSFAFPILTGDEKGGSLRNSSKTKKQLSRPTTGLKETPPVTPPESPKQPQCPTETPKQPQCPTETPRQPQCPTETPKQETPKAETPKATPRNTTGPKRWFSCFSCCPSCS